MTSSEANTPSDTDISGISSFISINQDDDSSIDPSFVGEHINIDNSILSSQSLSFNGPPSIIKFKEVKFDVIQKSANKKMGHRKFEKKNYCLKNRINSDAKFI
jgi:hypothetical protein